MQLLITTSGGKTLCLVFEEKVQVSKLKSKIEDVSGIPADEQRLSTGCRNLSNSQVIEESCILHLNLRLTGGKGGFGALLRGAGAKAGQKKITNFDDCRDLNGNRIRHIKNDKKMEDWYAGAKEREEEEEERKQKIREEAAQRNQYKFDPTQYVKSTKQITQNIEISVEEAMKAAKRKKTEGENPVQEEPMKKKTKRNMLWAEFDDFEDDKSKEEIDVLPKSKAVEKPIDLKEEEELFDLNKFSSAEELEVIGLEKLKAELMKLGLLCGGSLKERAQRLFSVKGKDLSTVDQKIRAKKKGKKK